MKGFIVEHSNVVIDNANFVQLFGRLDNGESFVVVKEFRPYFYLRKEDVSKVSKILKEFKVDPMDTKLKNFSKEPVVKLLFDLQADLNKCRHEIHKKEVNTFEADLKSSRRYLIDNNIFTSIEIDGDYESGELVDRVYHNPDVSPTNFRPNLKVLSLDIETGEKGELLCIGLYSDKYQKCFVSGGKKSKYKFVVGCKNEEEVLEKFKEEFLDFDADIITGWNVIDFDFAYLKGLFEKYKIKFNLGRTIEKSRLKLESDFFRSSTLKVSGRLVLDGLNFIRDPYIRDSPTIRSKNFENYTLDNVANEMVGKGKLLKGKNRGVEIVEFFEKDIDKLVDYNLMDCELVYEILEKSKMIDLAIERAELTGMTLDRIGSSILSFDSVYIREATRRGFVSPTMRYVEKSERITGGFVMSPVPGVYDNVLVFDFKSLYPSIIRTFNIDPLSFMGKNKEGAVCTFNGACFENSDGVLPGILDKLHSAREKAKKEKRELSSYAIKIIMNSFFGVLASPNCRYFNMDIANAITVSGQELIKKTQEMIGDKGYSVIYGDTDSIFVDSSEDEKDASATGKRVEKEINEFYDDYIRKEYKRKSFLELEFEKLYLSLMIPGVRGGNKKSAEPPTEGYPIGNKLPSGAKKRYAGLKKVNGKEVLEITGLEAIRGDWTEAAGEFQKELLMFVFHKEDFKKYILNFVKNLEKGNVDDKLVYRKQLRKNVEDYTKTTPPHVKAARKLKVMAPKKGVPSDTPRGTSEGNGKLIEYLVTVDGPEPLQDLKHKIDYKHYIDKQIKPVANSVLGILGQDFDEILKGNKQMSLAGF
jgi:DNA polymerase II